MLKISPWSVERISAELTRWVLVSRTTPISSVLTLVRSMWSTVPIWAFCVIFLHPFSKKCVGSYFSIKAARWLLLPHKTQQSSSSIKLRRVSPATRTHIIKWWPARSYTDCCVGMTLFSMGHRGRTIPSIPTLSFQTVQSGMKRFSLMRIQFSMLAEARMSRSMNAVDIGFHWRCPLLISLIIKVPGWLISAYWADWS